MNEIVAQLDERKQHCYTQPLSLSPSHFHSFRLFTTHFKHPTTTHRSPVTSNKCQAMKNYLICMRFVFE